MSALQIFENSGVRLRSVFVDGEPWFVAGDICKAVEIGNTSDAMHRLDEDEKGVVSIDTPGGMQQLRTVNESGMYALILRSRSQEPAVIKFRKWVTSEVLPAIRRTGGYGAAPQFAVPTSFVEALKLALDQTVALEIANEQIAVMAPKAEAHDALCAADGDMSVREAAQTLCRTGVETGQGRLFNKLVEINWLDKTKQPIQRHVDRGVLARKVTTYRDNLGDEHASTQVRITPKGITELARRLGGPKLEVVPA
jgi:anti-repressor protein